MSEQTLQKTYTYTARSADDPMRVVTFTLYDDKLAIGVGVPLEQAQRMMDARREEGDQGQETETEGNLWIKPVAVSLMERGTHPFNVKDVAAKFDGGRLNVTTWLRGAGLRLMPVRFTIDPVDNRDAAEAFVNELRRRKNIAEGVSRLPGPFDYWASWAAIGLLVPALIAVGVRLTSRMGNGNGSEATRS